VCPCARVCMCGYVYTCMCVYVCMHADDSQQYVCMHADDSQQYVCMHADDSQQPQGLAHHTHSTCDCVPPSTPLQPKPPRLGFAIRTQPKPGRFFRERRCQTSVLQCFTVCCSLFQDVKHKVCTPWKSERWGLLQQRWALCQKRRFGGKAFAHGRRWHRRWHTLQDMKQYTLQAYTNRCALRTHTRHCTFHTRIHDGMSHETHTYTSEHIAHTHTTSTYFI